MNNQTNYRCGFVAIIARPNVGKSTLLNHLIGQKISITSKKAQTTRHKIKGIYTSSEAQLIFIDTPGFQTTYQNAINQKLNENVLKAIQDSDLILFVVEANRYTEADEKILKKISEKKPTILVINKIDKANDPLKFSSFIEQIQAKAPFVATQLVSAKQNKGIQQLINTIKDFMPIGIPLYSEDLITDRSSKFLVAEIIREKIFRYIGEELPYLVNIEIDSFEELPNIININASILVEKNNHKGIIIGNKGEKLKKISMESRLDMEKLLQKKVFLQTWVKVKSGWAEDRLFLQELE